MVSVNNAILIACTAILIVVIQLYRLINNETSFIMQVEKVDKNTGNTTILESVELKNEAQARIVEEKLEKEFNITK